MYLVLFVVFLSLFRPPSVLCDKIPSLFQEKYGSDTMENRIEYIGSLGMFGLPAGLDRMKKVLSLLGNPQNNFKAVHIAGTNGKGSVTEMVSSALINSGKKVGRYISPHILDFTERIRIGKENIPYETLDRLSNMIDNTGVKLTEFEYITCIAFLYFSENKIDIAVVETGLGGRFDATNSLTNKSVAVITKIGLDHTSVLGNTIGEIAAEKCGIINCDYTVSSPNQPYDALKCIKEKSKNLVLPSLDNLKITSCDIWGNKFIYKGQEYETAMPGEYQIENVLVAIETLSLIGADVTSLAVKEGIKAATMPARLQVVSKNPLIVVDGAHNPDGARVLAKSLQAMNGVTAIVGVMADKDYKSVLDITLKFANRVICVTPSKKGRSLKASELARESEKYCKTFVAESGKAALELAKSFNDPIFIYGSLYLASDMLKIL